MRTPGHPAPAPVDGPRTVAGAGDWRAALVWAVPPGWTAVSSAPLGGGGTRPRWVTIVEVDRDYARTDPDRHLDEVARSLGLGGPGVGMLTAAPVVRVGSGACDGVRVWATVGVTHPTWAATPRPDEPSGGPGGPPAGTINIVGSVPVALSPAAVINAVMTVTEAKAQALWEAGVPGTGTATDALCVLSPGRPGPPEPFAGPRSRWGLRLAVATHRAVTAGLGAPSRRAPTAGPAAPGGVGR